MFALYTEVAVPETAPVDAVLDDLRTGAVPRMQSHGAVNAYWLGSGSGRITGLVMFEDERSARASAERVRLGDRPGNAPEGAAFTAVEVREVLAHL
jgi:hypothetical protein